MTQNKADTRPLFNKTEEGLLANLALCHVESRMPDRKIQTELHKHLIEEIEDQELWKWAAANEGNESSREIIELLLRWNRRRNEDFTTFPLISEAELKALNISSTGLGRNSGAESARESFDYLPKTPLGSKLWEIRKRILASGEQLLDWDDLEREVAERRGESTRDDDDHLR